MDDYASKNAAGGMPHGTSMSTSNSNSKQPSKDSATNKPKNADLSKNAPTKDHSKAASADSYKNAPTKDTSKAASTDSAKNAPTKDPAKAANKDPMKTGGASKDPSKGSAQTYKDGAKSEAKNPRTTSIKEVAEEASAVEDLKLATIRGALEAQTREQIKAGDEVPVPTLLQPFCPRELLLSKPCANQLAMNNSIKGKISFIVVVATIGVCALCHAIALPVMSHWSYWNQLRALQTFDFPHVRTPCAVIRSLDTSKDDLVFHDMPYASFTHRFEDSHMVETFQDCYWTYYLQSDRTMASFKDGVFYWDYEFMTAQLSDRTAWRLQSRLPGGAETVGRSERLSLSIITPRLDGSRPVVVLVTGNDFTLNKPVLPPPAVARSLDCVLVTINYRLGLDGAAVLYRENYMGNLFARDVTQALAWLHLTVHNFGGDAKRIVYFGEGSGATLGLWLMLAPDAVNINRFWLMDPSVEIPAFSELGTMIEDIFLEDPSPLATTRTQSQIDQCYSEFKHRLPAPCMNEIALSEVMRITPKWMTQIYNYLDEFPDLASRNTSERSLLYLPPTMLNNSLLSNLRDGKLQLADKTTVFHSSSASDFYWALFPTGRRNETRYRVETDLRQSLERLYIRRDSRQVGSAIVQQYVNLMKAEINEDEIDYEEVRRMVQHDIRILCPVQALMYHLLVQQVMKSPIYNLLDLSSYQSIPILVGDTNMHCNLPRFMMHDFNDSMSAGACRLAFDIGEDGKRRMRDYRTAALGMLGDFAHGRTRADHHPLHLLAAVGSAGGEGFDSSANMLDHRGNLPGMDTRRSQLVKSVCHDLYGPTRSDWHALLYLAKYN